MLYSPTPMHTPDGFLSLPVALLFWVISVTIIGYGLKRVSRDLGERQVPLMGIVAAAIFAGQMLNFSVAGGTSGHLLGAAIAAILLGPWGAMIVLTCVVSIQALIFQDGGLLALGANLFNMAIVGVAVSYAVYRIVQKLAGGRRWGLLAGGALAAWSSIFVASLSCAIQLALSGTSPANIAIPAMAGIHALIGLGEALITLGALAFIRSARPDLLQSGEENLSGTKTILVGGLVLAVGLAILSPLASSHPDGLEWVAEQNGFLQAAQRPVYSLIPDYLLPGIDNKSVATILAGVIGALIVFGAALGVAYTRRKRGSAGA